MQWSAGTPFDLDCVWGTSIDRCNISCKSYSLWLDIKQSRIFPPPTDSKIVVYCATDDGRCDSHCKTFAMTTVTGIKSEVSVSFTELTLKSSSIGHHEAFTICTWTPPYDTLITIMCHTSVCSNVISVCSNVISVVFLLAFAFFSSSPVPLMQLFFF